ncbi:josephin-2-like [Paramacrobiotus metropolitanus]|uniref:josephin-2-like n=1 Tax=Paramacrobiotus metropolitanus TaxID=2943436 RepID=UPI0024461EEA|nr:josephin-2-like [Paramacrobiotus metropolitanus]
MDSRSHPQVYHEHQVKQFCAMHALNNLFGEPCFSKKSLDEICDRLTPSKGWTNPHRSFFGFGNYDVNVVMVAVQSRNCEAIWWDKRNDLSSLDLSNVVGLILNLPNDYGIGSFKLPLGRRHWISIRPVSVAGTPPPSSHPAAAGREPKRMVFYNLDSKFKAPLLIGNEAAVITFLREALGTKGGEMLVVVQQPISAEKSA